MRRAASSMRGADGTPLARAAWLTGAVLLLGATLPRPAATRQAEDSTSRGAAASVAAEANPVAPQASSSGEIHALIVAGLGGTQEYRQRFNDWAVELYTALTRRHGIPEERVTYLGERLELAPRVMDARSTRDNLLATLEELAGSVGPSDRVLIVLIGHGTSQRREARFNLPGPDIAPAGFAEALSAFESQPLALVHTGSASGGFLGPLSGPGRIVITATSSAQERNATEFARFFVEAVTGEASDMDKDGRTSLLEAFSYARLEVERFYEEENEILTEHALLDDNGDGEGSPEASADGPDGTMAAAFHLRATPAVTGQQADDPVLARLYRERTEIQERIDGLRAVRESLEREEYEARLEELLVELALKNREIRAREGGAT